MLREAAFGDGQVPVPGQHGDDDVSRREGSLQRFQIQRPYRYPVFQPGHGLLGPGKGAVPEHQGLASLTSEDLIQVESLISAPEARRDWGLTPSRIDKIPVARVERRKMQYLYGDGEQYTFMNS